MPMSLGQKWQLVSVITTYKLSTNNSRNIEKEWIL